MKRGIVQTFQAHSVNGEFNRPAYIVGQHSTVYGTQSCKLIWFGQECSGQK